MSALLIAFIASVLVQTPAARDARGPDAAPSGTARINGMVTSADSTARPIRSAYVVLIGGLTGTLRVTSSDSNGRFSFAGLPADRYLIGASKPPYLGAVAGAKRPARPGVPLVLAAGQTLNDIAVRLPMGAAISGQITDERGRPAGSIALVAQQWRMQNGERTLVSVPGANATTDDRGRFRLFGLPPGEYVVGATPFQPDRNARELSIADVDAALRGNPPEPPPAGATQESTRFAPVFFPGTARQSEASPIVLTVGEDRQGVDFRLVLTRTARVEGVLTNYEPQPNRLLVIMTPASANSLQRFASTAQVGPDGRFAMTGVTPGTYTITARTSGPQQGQFASATVDVSGADVTGIQLTLRPPLTVAGKLVFQGSLSAPSLAGRRLTVRSLAMASPMVTPQVAPTDADGNFSIMSVTPGRYVIGSALFLGATTDSMTWALESVTVDGRDLTDQPIEISADLVPKTLVVTFSDQSAQLSGRLQSGSTVASEYTLVLFPSDRRYWFQGSRRILVARPGTDGQFTFGGSGPTSLATGEYLLAVVTDLDRDEQFDPAFLSTLIAGATHVSLAKGEKKSLDVQIR
jgi:carboxypeptidase family protein